jgi:hypothetical protein
VYDNIVARAGSFYWGNGEAVRTDTITVALSGSLMGQDFPGATQSTNITGFALGSEFAYFGEPGTDNVCSADHKTPCVQTIANDSRCHDPDAASCSSVCDDARWVCPEATPVGQTCVTLGYVEKGAAPPFESDTPPSAVILARDQPTPTSFALDGTNVYWATSACDIRYMADSPQ